jgi:hypothetical protein
MYIIQLIFSYLILYLFYKKIEIFIYLYALLQDYI